LPVVPYRNLSRPLHCPIVGETTSNGYGYFEFDNLPVGPQYTVHLFPPTGWKAKDGNLVHAVDVTTSSGNGRGPIFDMEPGDQPTPTLPTPPADCGPAPQGPPPPPADATPAAHTGLAYTGVDVVGLTAVGALVLLAGAGAVMVSRRRRAVS
jgi:LPXTG-motif cell wall-anchored protein